MNRSTMYWGCLGVAEEMKEEKLLNSWIWITNWYQDDWEPWRFVYVYLKVYCWLGFVFEQVNLSKEGWTLGKHAWTNGYI